MSFNYKKYCIALVFYFFALVIVVIGFNFTVDSLGVFHDVRIEGFNKKKPEIRQLIRQFKVLSVDKYRPEAIILGTSRSDASLHPDIIEKNKYPLKYYNFAIFGSSVYEMRRYLEHAYYVHNIKEAIIGLDFEKFDSLKRSDEKKQLSDGLLSVKNDGSEDKLYSIKTYASLLFSFDAVKNSFSTIKRQKRHYNTFKKNGARVYTTDRKRFLRAGGVSGVSKHYINNYRATASKGSKETLDMSSKQDSPAIEELKKIISFSAKNNIKINFFVTPVHACMEEARNDVRLYSLNERWKKQVANIVFDANDSNKEGSLFKVWDFSGYNSITTEPYPPIGDTKTELKYFTDPVHFTAGVGDLILSKILGFEGKVETSHQDFGVLFEKENIESHLLEIQGKRQVFLNDNKDCIKL